MADDLRGRLEILKEIEVAQKRLERIEQSQNMLIEEKIKATVRQKQEIKNLANELRQVNLERIKGVSRVFIFDSSELLEELIKVYEPDVFVIGSDYKSKPIVGEQYAKSIVYFNRMEEFSTTKILTNE